MLGTMGAAAETYPNVDTGQRLCFDNRRVIADLKPNEPFFGQAAQVVDHQVGYRDNGDGTISDLVTGLMWTADPVAKRSAVLPPAV